MLAAHRMNLTDPQTNVWYTLDLFNASYFGHGSWQRGDSHDADAYESYKGNQSNFRRILHKGKLGLNFGTSSVLIFRIQHFKF